MRRVWGKSRVLVRVRARQRAEAEEQEAVAEESATPEVEALLDAVRRSSPRPGEEHAEGAEHAEHAEKAAAALAAYREARDSGAHAVQGRWWRARRRDDWRPSRRRGALPVRAAFASAAATVTLGGMALAAGAGAIPSPFGIGGGGGSGGGGAGAGATRTHSGAPATPDAGRGSPEGAARLPSAAASRSRAAWPAPAKDHVAHCVAYLVSHGRSASGRGAASERLAAAAAEAGLTVEAYCEGVLAAERRQPGAGAYGKGVTKPPKPPKSPNAPKGSKASKPGAAPNTPEPETEAETELPAKTDDTVADPAGRAGNGQGGNVTLGSGEGESGRQ